MLTFGRRPTRSRADLPFSALAPNGDGLVPRPAVRQRLPWQCSKPSESNDDKGLPRVLVAPPTPGSGRLGLLSVAPHFTIRDAGPTDWEGIWPFLSQIVQAGETYTWPRLLAEEDARARWMSPPPGRVFVAVDENGAVVGTAKLLPNNEGGGSHVANASFMVDPAQSGLGVGRALAEHVLVAASAAGYRAMQFNAVVETNIRAVRLWRSVGFKVLATVPQAFDHPVHGLVGLHIMHRSLP